MLFFHKRGFVFWERVFTGDFLISVLEVLLVWLRYLDPRYIRHLQSSSQKQAPILLLLVTNNKLFI